jgi:hypothetical protein
MTAAQPEIDRASAEEVGQDRRKGRMDQMIETFASGLGNSVGWLAEHGVLFIVFAVIWVAFGAGLLLSQGSLDQAWQAIRGLPLVVQVGVWLLFLPVMIGLWVWETTWPLILRLVLVLGIAGWNLLVFLPKALQAARP